MPRLISLLFDDLAAISEWARPYVETAVLGGLITGFDDDTFRPQDHVTRPQVVVMLSRVLRLTPAGEPPFADADEIPGRAAGDIAALSHLDVRGYLEDGEHHFRPDIVTTRAEAAAFLHRYLVTRSLGQHVYLPGERRNHPLLKRFGVSS